MSTKKIEYELLESTPGIYTEATLKEFEEIISYNSHNMSTTSNPRTIIMETWLILDWFIKHQLIMGLGLEKYHTNEFDPHFEILPFSFEGCVDLLNKLLNDQKKYPKKPSAPNYELRGSHDIWEHIEQHYPDVMDGINRAKHSLLIEKGIIDKNSVIGSYCYMPKETEGIFRSVTDSWLQSLSEVDKEWVKKAKRINKARNYAAHRNSHELIYETMGKSGPNRLEELRQECYSILEQLIGLKIIIKKIEGAND